MADQSNDSKDVSEQLSRINHAAAWLDRSGYSTALYDLVSQIEDTCSQRFNMCLEEFNSHHDDGRKAYLEGMPFRNYQNLSGEKRKSWRAGWLFEAGENAHLIKANEQLLLHAQEYLEATTVAKNQIKHLAKSAVHSKHRHELSRCISMMNHLTSSLETIVNNKPNEASKSHIKKAEAVSYG